MLEETAYLLRSPANVGRLLESLDQARSGTVQEHDGRGEPEQLRLALAGAWSRRIDEEHPLVYLVDRDDIVILQARQHYG